MIGETVSHYEIISKLGEGGMGAVYKALDTTLDRHVAIKFLPPHLRSDKEAKKRFVREAKAASALNHYNIGVIHEIDETSEGQMFIVMTCYDGDTLKDKLEAGPFSLAEAIDIGIQVAEGLSKAHEAGIVHRDVKPANILTTNDGVVKIVDFGIAKLGGMTRVTRTGMTMGTVSYMSPEQAGGKEVDARADIFSLGVVLYELLTGQIPFPGDHEAAIMYGILNSDPMPMSEYRRETTKELQSVIERALHKDPEGRYQSAAEFRDALEKIESELTGSKRARRRTSSHIIGTRAGFSRKAIFAITAGIVIVGAAAVIIAPRFFTSTELLQASPRITPLITGEEIESAPQWSPGGNMIAFEAWKDGIWDIWVSDLDGANSINLTRSSGSTDRCPAWSPDGQRIAFYSDRAGPGIYTMTATGGSVRRAVSVEPMLVQESLLHLHWAYGDRLIFGHKDSTMRADTYEYSLVDRNLRCLTCSQPEGAHFGSLSPSGDYLAFRRPVMGNDVEVFILDMQTGKTSQISLPALEISWAPDGESLFLISTLQGSRDLWTVAIDPGSGTQKGEPRRLTTAVSLSEISFSPSGTRAVGCISSSKSNLWIFPTDTGPVTSLEEGERVTSGMSHDNIARWMPDGVNIVYSSDRRGEQQIWMQGPGSGQPFRISDNKSGYPVVSPDGRWIAFTIFEENGGYSTQVVRPDGSDLHYLYPELREDHPFVVATDWSRGGRKIVYHTMIDDEWFLGVITVDPESGTATGMGLIGLKGAIPFWSPDGTHLVYHIAEDGQPDLCVSSVDGKDKYRLTDDPAAEWLAGWSENPSFIYYGRMMENGHKEVYRIAMDDNGRPKSQPELWMVFPPPVVLRQVMDFHTNRALGAVYEAESDIVLLEFKDPPSR